MSSETQTTDQQTVELITRFENNFNTGDIDAIMGDMTDDPVFEHVAPEAVSFGRHEGAAAVRAVWESMPEHFPNCEIEPSNVFASGERAACEYAMSFDTPDGRVTFRGADLFRISGGKIAEKLTYLTM